MKFLASLFSFFALASAQALYISSPTPGQNVPLDTYLIVEIYSDEIFSENVCFAFRYFHRILSQRLKLINLLL